MPRRPKCIDTSLRRATKQHNRDWKPYRSKAINEWERIVHVRCFFLFILSRQWSDPSDFCFSFYFFILQCVCLRLFVVFFFCFFYLVRFISIFPKRIHIVCSFIYYKHLDFHEWPIPKAAMLPYSRIALPPSIIDSSVWFLYFVIFICCFVCCTLETLSIRLLHAVTRQHRHSTSFSGRRRCPCTLRTHKFRIEPNRMFYFYFNQNGQFFFSWI